MVRDVEVHYLTELDKWDRWATWDIEYAIRGRTYDVAKLELYAFQFHAFDQPRVVRQLVQLIFIYTNSPDLHFQNMTARHLALTINLDSSGHSDVTQVGGEWYQLLYWLFFEGYALIGATSSGLCGQESQNCKYRVSLMRVETAESWFRVTAPVFGLGSPKEELNRLVSYLRASDCNYTVTTSFPTFCFKNFNDSSKVVLITYRELRYVDIPSMLSRLPNFHLASPTAVDSTGLKIHRYGIGPPHINETVDGQWKLITL
ncbi:hypothetical protein GCK32_012423, partial [Trichostrongylus colubriformis]